VSPSSPEDEERLGSQPRASPFTKTGKCRGRFDAPSTVAAPCRIEPYRALAFIARIGLDPTRAMRRQRSRPMSRIPPGSGHLPESAGIATLLKSVRPEPSWLPVVGPVVCWAAGSRLRRQPRRDQPCDHVNEGNVTQGANRAAEAAALTNALPSSCRRPSRSPPRPRRSRWSHVAKSGLRILGKRQHIERPNGCLLLLRCSHLPTRCWIPGGKRSGATRESKDSLLRAGPSGAGLNLSQGRCGQTAV